MDLLLIKVYFSRLTESILRDRSIRRKNRLPSRRRKNRFHPMHIVVSCAMSHAQGQMPMLHTWKDQNIKRYTEMQVVMVVFHPLIMKLCSPKVSFGNHITTRGDWKDNMSKYCCLVITYMFLLERKLICNLALWSCFRFSPLFSLSWEQVKCFGRNSLALAEMYVT